LVGHILEIIVAQITLVEKLSIGERVRVIWGKVREIVKV
jgi:hypothetical protein